MTTKTWKDWILRYYPIAADAVPKDGALEHSILKWRGLQRKVLRAHGMNWANELRVVSRSKPDGITVLPINGDSCVLCTFYSDNIKCTGCPLYEVRGRVRCDGLRSGEKKSPWVLRASNPGIMLWWLYRARRWADQKKLARKR